MVGTYVSLCYLLLVGLTIITSAAPSISDSNEMFPENETILQYPSEKPNEFYWHVGKGYCKNAKGVSNPFKMKLAHSVESCGDSCLSNVKCRSFSHRAKNCQLFDEYSTGVVSMNLHNDCYNMQERIFLSKIDFADGTLIINRPGIYILTEDIEFLPYDIENSQDFDPATLLFPEAGSKYHNIESYSLGFFAAIAIETEDVIFDLNGFAIYQSEAHSLIQRFFSLIELCSSPFPSSKGPANFGSNTKCASRTIIRNGKLGLSSHHGIHGNNNKDIVIQNLEISEFEVSGIALNNISGLEIQNVVIQNSRTDVPVNGRFSGALNQLRLAVLGLEVNNNHDLALVRSTKQLSRSLKKTIREVLTEKQVSNNLFQLKTDGLPDGSLVCGIQIHPTINVGTFWDSEPTSSEIMFRNVIIRGIKGHPTEVSVMRGVDMAPIQDYSGTHVRDAFGFVLDFDLARNDDNTYVSNILSVQQLAIAKLKLECNDRLVFPKCNRMDLINRSFIPEEVVKWTEGELNWSDLLSSGYVLQKNHDWMFHFIKGVIGLKIDGATKIDVSGVKITRIHNYANENSRANSENPNSSTEKYLGYEANGMTIAAVDRAGYCSLKVRKIRSHMPGNTYRIDTKTNSTNIQKCSSFQ